jgi:hypothetical protein
MILWRSIAFATAGSAAAILAGPLVGIDPWVGVVLSALLAFAWAVVGSMRETADDEERGDRWVVLATYMNLADAYLARSVLQGSNIACAMPEEHTAGARSELVVAMQGIRLMVPASELERARDLLASKGKNTSW